MKNLYDIMGIMNWAFSVSNQKKVIKKYMLEELFDNQFSTVYCDEMEKYILKVFKGDDKDTIYENEKNYLTMFSTNEKIKDHIPKILEYNDKEKYILMDHKGKDGIILINDREYGADVYDEFIKQVPIIMNEFFKAGYVHRDIKPENLVYDANTKKWSIIDFAFMEPLKYKPETGLKFRGTYPYCAPFLGNRLYFSKFVNHNKKEDVKLCADIYSFAISLFAMEGNDHITDKVLTSVEMSLKPVYNSLINPEASLVKKKLAEIILACIDYRYDSVTWYHNAKKGHHCHFTEYKRDANTVKFTFEHDIIKCWENFISIIENQILIEKDVEAKVKCEENSERYRPSSATREGLTVL